MHFARPSGWTTLDYERLRATGADEEEAWIALSPVMAGQSKLARRGRSLRKPNSAGR